MQGATGAQGVKGDTGISGSVGSTGAAGANGTQGIQGEVGSTGTQGIKGDTGTSGSVGTAGAAGTNGTQGIQGIQGIKGDTGLTGSQGIQGDTGTSGSVGAAGAAGAAGANGTQGIQGIQGVSKARITSFTFTPNLVGTAGSTRVSQTFGDFLPGNIYVVRVLISTYDANAILSTYGLGLSISAVGDSPGIEMAYFVANGTLYSGTNKGNVSIIADLIIDGSSTTNAYSLVATLTSGAVVTASIYAYGKCTQLLVGSIG